LKGLEESGDIEQVGLGRSKKGVVKPYKPRSLRKTASSRVLVKKEVPRAAKT